MRNKARAWFLLSLALMLGAVWFWREGERRREAGVPPQRPAAARSAGTNTAAARAPSAARPGLRLANTREGVGALARKDSAILLRNALIDTALPLALDIPAELRATNGRSYIVQSAHPLDAAFYTALERAGAKFVSYIPNNAALVEASAGQMAGLTNFTTLPYEPYYKLATDLLADSVNHTPVTNALCVITPPGTREQARAEIQGRGWALLGEDRSPLGPEFIVQVPGPDAAIAVAQWPLAQEVETYRRRVPLSDLTRVRLGVSANTVTPTNYLGLNGANIWMNLNDTGADDTHPELKGRLFNFITDDDGHGTHVAGIMIGNGTNSETVSNALGSVKGANFRGMAPLAKLWVQSIDLVVGPIISNEALQTNASANLRKNAPAAGVTNGFISNNSWGTGGTSYDLTAASFDAAVRDAEPLVTGEQAMTYVFAAGNSGEGSGSGLDNVQNTIDSPGTAKNVITVGAIDSPRHITNQVSVDCQTTNAIFLPPTSDSNQVAYFSSAGNVSPGQEGAFGRFKPDVVAPGVFIISARATNFTDPTNQQFLDFQQRANQVLAPGQTDSFTNVVPDDAQLAWIQTVPNAQSPTPFPTLTITARPLNGGGAITGPSPLLLTNQLTPPGRWKIDVSAPPGGLARPVAYDLDIYIVETNYLCDYYNVLSNLNSNIGPWYRYESGTSMAAPAAAGVLALVQQYFASNHFSASPALLKALLINGARSVGRLYDFDVQPSLGNEQGWGLINLPTTLPHTGTGGFSNLTYLEQSPLTALQTGRTALYTVDVKDEATNFPLRITLVWTDPPGNPAAGLALVNDLDLVVNDSAGHVYIGNNFHAGDIFTPEGSTFSDTVNNVENVYLDTSDAGLEPPFTVTVRGVRVNVNAVTSQTNNIEQDYALVVSSDDPDLSSALTLTAAVGPPLNSSPQITITSNNVALLNERVGANSPYDYRFPSGQTNGTLAQWHFFIFTNDTVAYGTNYTNVAFVTFLPPDLSLPRITQEADIDLYVSTNSGLLNLDPNVIAQAVADGNVSRQRGGTEAVVFTNSQANEIYYIGVKSEDQQAATFGFLGAARQAPFSDQMPNGDIIAHGIPLPMPIPDGSFDHPGTTNVLAIVEGGSPIHIRHVIVTNGITHQNPGDLVGSLSFQQKQVILNNHTGASTNYVFVYDDQPEFPGAVHTDGPGSLTDYIGLLVSGAAVWRLDETDTALGQTGAINQLDILMEHQPPNTGTFGIFLDGFGSYYGYVEVPTDATNLSIAVTYKDIGNAGPVAIYATNNPTVSTDTGLKTTGITPPGGILNINRDSNPPLAGGIWYYLIQNNSASPVSLDVTIEIKENLTPNWIKTFTNNTPTDLATDAHTQSQICLSEPALHQQLVSLNVGVRLDDPSLDNLVLHLTSPKGTSVLLFENRGGPLVTNLGLDTPDGRSYYTTFTEDTNLATSLIKFTPVFARSNYSAPIVASGFETTTPGTYDTGLVRVFDNWTVLTNQVGIVADPVTARTGNNFLALTTGRISRTFNTTKGATYQLIYYTRGPGIANWWTGDGNAKDIIGNYNGVAQSVIYDDAKVGRGFKFNRADSVVTFGAQAGKFGVNDFSIDYWIISPTTDEAFFEKRPVCNSNPNFIGIRTLPSGIPQFEITGDGIGYTIVFGPKPINDGGWHHLTWTRQGVNLRFYLDGALAAVSATPFVININNNSTLTLGQSICVADSTQPFGGAADELDIWNRAMSPAEALGIFKADSAGKYSTNSVLPNMYVFVDGNSTNLVINNSSNWVAFTNTFIATNRQTTIEFAGNSALSMLLDDIQLVKAPTTNHDNYFMPEESLSTFVGQDPNGCWTLDVWDTRNDSLLPTRGVLESWTLDLTFSSTNINLVVLTNHVPYSTNAPPNGIVYFAFDVPTNAAYVTNTITNFPAHSLSLLFNQTDLPGDGLDGDYPLVALTPPDLARSNTLSDVGTPPPLLAGRRYYLGVRNTGAEQAFTMRVDTEILPTNQLTVLSNSVVLNTNILANADPEYFSFDVPSNAVLASFQILNATNGEVDLYARRGLPLPGPLNFHYKSVVLSSSNQPIIVTTNSSFTTNSAPVPLLPGTWYLAAYNAARQQNLHYQIIASYLTDATVITIIPLTNGVAFTNIASPGFPTNLYYSFTNQPRAAGVRFVLTNLTLAGNVDLVIGLGALPAPSQFYAGSFRLGNDSEWVQLGTNSALPLMNDTWYLAVPNDWTNKVRYSVEAFSIATPQVTNYPVITGPLVMSESGFTISWLAIPGEVYEVDYSSDLVTWSQAVQFTATNRLGSFNDPTPVTNEARYYRLRQLPSE